ncbi:MAG: hypothetical protein WCG25_02025 [bacterium]
MSFNFHHHFHNNHIVIIHFSFAISTAFIMLFEFQLVDIHIKISHLFHNYSNCLENISSKL